MSIRRLPATMAPSSRHGIPPRTSFGSLLGFAAAILVTLTTVAIGATHHPVLTLLPLAVICAVVGAVGSPGSAMLTAAICWGCDAGFVLGRSAHLTFDVATARSAAVLLAATAIGNIVGRLRHSAGGPSGDLD